MSQSPHLGGTEATTTTSAFFPTVTDFCCTYNRPFSHERPTEVGPILDPTKTTELLSVFDKRIQQTVYGDHSGLDAEREIPLRPEIFEDRYLYPSLTSDEYRRLTALWYHSYGLNEDDDFLAKLEHIVNILKDTFAWEFAIIGLLDGDCFIRLATSNLPLAILPRRESTCSHTVNMQPGTIFSVYDMSSDWRFKNSPHVSIGGLRSYAGTQLRVRLQDGQEVALGSLCIASNAVQASLEEVQKQRLLKTADLVVSELLARTRARRLKARETMLNHLTRLRAPEIEKDPIAAVLQILQEVYPGDHVGLELIRKNTIIVDNNATHIHCSRIRAGLWEDTDLIRSNLQFEGPIAATQRFIRAVVGQLGENDRAIVVASRRLRLVFDDVDAWFIDQCAQFVRLALKEAALKDALAAKEIFLRSITHDLRTPIHGVLSGVELLGEELYGRISSQPLSKPIMNHNEGILDDCLTAIKRSGLELMMTINSILKFNALSGRAPTLVPVSYDLRNLEDNVLDDVLQIYDVRRLQRLSINFLLELPDSQSTIVIDANVLKELVKSLLINAIDNTRQGCISVRVATGTEEGSVVFSISSDATFDKSIYARQPTSVAVTEHYWQGPGVSLTLATQMAMALNASLSLSPAVSGYPSQLHLKLSDVEFRIQTTPPKHMRASHSTFSHLPSTFYVLRRSLRSLHFLAHVSNYLEQCGLQQSTEMKDTLILTHQPEPFDSCFDDIIGLQKPHAVIVVIDTAIDSLSRNCLVNELKPHTARHLEGPLFTSRLDSFMKELNFSFGQSQQAPTVAIQIPDGHQVARSVEPSDISTISAVDLPVAGMRTPTCSMKILIVDDNEVNLKVLEMYCKKRNHLSVKARDGKEAVESFSKAVLAGKSDYNLILMDLQMPVCDGVDACKQLRALEASQGLERTVVFMVTGQDSATDRNLSYEAGADDYLVKPVSLKRLDKAIADHFRKL